MEGGNGFFLGYREWSCGRRHEWMHVFTAIDVCIWHVDGA